MQFGDDDFEGLHVIHLLSLVEFLGGLLGSHMFSPFVSNRVLALASSPANTPRERERLDLFQGLRFLHVL